MIEQPPAHASRSALLDWAGAQLDAAAKLIDEERFDEAHERYMTVARHIDEDDPSAQAGLLWKQLGVTWRSRTAGLKRENLLASKVMLERALVHPVRRADPVRLALTLDQLAVTLRQLIPHEPERASALASRAGKLFKAALRRLDSISVSGPKTLRHGLLRDRTGTRINLANLYASQERFDEAVAEYRRALNTVERERRPPADAVAQMPQLRLNLAAALVKRNQTDDRQQARPLFDSVVRCKNPRLRAQARMASAMAAHEEGRDDDARTLLAEIEPGFVGPEGEFVVLGLLKELRAYKKALVLSRAFIRRASLQRATTLSTGNVDHASRHLHLLTAVVARIHAAQDEPVEAFIALESQAAKRFDETVRQRLLEHADRVSLELTSMSIAADDCAITFEQAVGDVAIRAQLDSNSAAADQLAALRRYWAGPQPVRVAGPRCSAIRQEAARRAEEALCSADPAAGLLAAREYFAREGERLRAVAMNHDPGLRDQWYALPVLEPSLAALARERADEVFIRIHAWDDILAVAVWHDDSGLCARHVSIPYSSDDRAIIGSMHAELDSVGDGRAAAVFARLDLSPVFPAERNRTAVFLPSRLAAGLPLAALGPPGQTPLDRFAAVRIMPNLRLFATPPATHVPRVGHRAFIGPDTLRGPFAFDELLPNERTVEGPAASMAALNTAFAEADVVSVYAHGRHLPGRPPSIRIEDGHWWPESGHSIVADMRGLERVEIWACRSGSIGSNDGRSPPLVDELTGLDGICLESGARSTLGALLPVREVVAAEIARTYRLGIARGMRADRALADAQRWWRDVRLPTLVAGGHAEWLDGLLGAGETPTEVARERLRRQLRCPSAWAVFRIMGVCERRPSEGMPFDPDRPLSTEEEAQVDVALANDAEPPPSPDADDAADAIDALLADAEAEALTGPITAEHALRLASILRARVRADSRHNLVRALSWIHDALAASDVSEHDRTQLVACAAHLWLDLAVEETGPEVLLGRALGVLPILGRVRNLVDTLPADYPSSARGLLHAAKHFASALSDPSSLERLAEAVALLGPIERLPFDEIERAAALIGWAAEHTCFEPAGMALIERLKTLMPNAPGERLDEFFTQHRIVGAVKWMAWRLELPEAAFTIQPDYLPAGPRARSMAASGQMFIDSLGETGRWFASDALIAFLQSRDEHLWGRMGQRDVRRWRGSGGHGVWWWGVTSAMVEAALAQAHDPMARAPHLMASLHLGADLRTQQLHRWSSLENSPQMRAIGQLSPCGFVQGLMREICLDVLADTAVTGAAVVDPFALDIGPLRAGHDGEEAVAWIAADIAGCFAGDEIAHGRTVAGRLVRAVAVFERDIAEHWPRLLEAEERAPTPILSAASAPEQDLKAWESRLLDQPTDVAHISLGLLRDQRVYGLLVHRTTCRMAVVDDVPSHADLFALFTALGQPLPILGDLPILDDLPAPAAVWDRVARSVVTCVGPLVDAALDAGARHLRILAPGALRMVPWIGLPIGGRLLTERLAERGGSVVHLPALGWESPSPQQEDRGGDPLVDGTLCHLGDAALDRVVRQSSCAGGTRLLDPRGGRYANKSELDRIALEVKPITRLRLVGAEGNPGGVTDDALLDAFPQGLITVRDISRLTFARGAEVEFWAATDPRPPEAWATPNRDRLPGFVRAALRGGAAGALDLAWPIDPLAKALLCEQFALLTRHRTLGGAVAAVHAVHRVRQMLGDLPEDANWREALDDRRAGHWLEAVGDRLPMPSLADAEVGRPDVLDDPAALAWQLAAVRWWGVER